MLKQVIHFSNGRLHRINDMTTFPGYTEIRPLIKTGENEPFSLYQARSKIDLTPVIIKCQTSHFTSAASIHQLENEFKLTQSLNAESILKPIRIEDYPERTTLVFEGFEGTLLETYLKYPMGIEQFLKIAIKISSTLIEIHRKNIIHKDIKPRNIFYNEGNGQIKFTGFGIASSVFDERDSLRTPHLIEGTPAYMSPEQTGRMNQSIDFRTDLYSLGITFYQMLSGNLPFEASDTLEWFHYHIAQKPKPLTDILPNCPKLISDIVGKLISKIPNDRYQSAAGLKYDLEKAFQQLQKKHRILPFPLAKHDIPEQFQIPKSLYGREMETSELHKAYDQVTKNETPAFVLISGSSGVGKSSLVQELHDSILQNQGIFISGKFDQIKKEIPYYTITQAFHSLISQILSQTEVHLSFWRKDLKEALGPNAQLLIDVVPEIKLIIGPQPAIPELSPTEAQTRLNLVFHNFLKVFAKKEHPLTLFLDNLQWADSATLKFIQQIFLSGDIHYFFFIGAYRSTDLSANHPLLTTLDEIKKTNFYFRGIHLAPLSFDDLNQFIAEILHCKTTRALSLTRMIYKKTKGNPFYSTQFLKMLHQDGFIFFDTQKNAWRWDTHPSHSPNHIESFLDFLIERLQKLPPDTENVMKLASCIGNKGDIRILAMIYNERVEEVIEALFPAVQESLISIEANRTYRFTHDKIQQASYSLISEENKAQTHLTIGRILLKTHLNNIEENVFEIVNQLNLGVSLIHTTAEKHNISELNFISGRKAKRAGAFKAASQYLNFSFRLLPDQAWENLRDFTYTLHREIADCEYLQGNFNEAERRTELLLKYAQTKLEQVSIFRLQVDIFTSQGRVDRAINTGLKALKLFDLEIPLHPTKAQVLEKIDEVEKTIGNRDVNDLIHLPIMTNPEIKSILDLLAVLFAPALSLDPYLPFVCYCHMTRLSLIHGHSDASALAYAYFGMTLGEFLGKYREGYRFAKLGYDLTEKRGFIAYKARVNFIFGDTVNFFSNHLRTDLPYLNTAFKTAIESNDLTTACYTCNHLVVDLFILGKPLEEVYQESEVRLEFTRKVNFDASTNVIIGIQRVIQNMRGLTLNFSTFADSQFDQVEFEKKMNNYSWSIVTCWYYIMKLQARFLSNDFEEAIEAGNKAKKLLWTSYSHIQEPEYWYYYALSVTSVFSRLPPELKEKHLDTLFTHQTTLKKWANSCPENFLNKYALVSAEISRITQKSVQDTLHLYDLAIRSARENEYIQNEGIANELAGKYCFSIGLESIGQNFIQQARICYLKWGAIAKANHISQQYPFIIEAKFALSETLTASQGRLDLHMVIKASQAISHQIVLTDLYTTLTRILLESAGAELAFLLIMKNNTLTVEAEARIDHPFTIQTFPSIPIENFKELPLSLVHYTARTQEKIALDDASNQHLFFSDEYINNKKPKSVLVLPILWQDHLLGIFYLENNQISGAFTQNRLTLLDLLSSQAAISLENAQLYADLNISEKRMRAIIDNASTIIFMKDLQGRYLLTNLQFEKVFHIKNEDCYGKTDFELWPQKTAEALRSNDLKSISTKSAIESEETVPQKNGTPHTYLSMKFPLLDEQGEPYAICGISTDINDRILAEKERLQILQELQQALRLRDEFILIASHELRTPLTPVKLNLELMKKLVKQSPLSDLQTTSHFLKMIDTSNHQIDRLFRLIEDLLDTSRITSGYFSLKREHINLSDLIQDILERFKPELEKAKSPLVLSLDQSVIGHWDSVRIEQAVINLLTNAVKYGAGKPIEVSVSSRVEGAQISVKDFGIGISKDDQSRIFGRFERAASPFHFGGLGLGLYITKQIIDRHGGKINVISEPGKGSTFTIIIPTEEMKESQKAA